MTLLYQTAEWHALAKLRLHTESTVQRLEGLTTELGKSMRYFRDTTQASFETFELPKEMGTRQRQKSGKGKEKVAAGTSGRKPRNLNLFTYKWHALGDYVRAIRLFGGTDGFSTQVVSDIRLDLYLLLDLLYLVGRANLLINLSNACTEQQTNATLNAKLPSVFEDLNVPLWPLIGSGFTTSASRT